MIRKLIHGVLFALGIITTPPLTPTNPLVSPLLYPSPLPSRHPTTHITVAGCDVLCDQGVAYALKLRDAGIDTTLEVLPGVPHGFTWVVKSKATMQWTRRQIRLFDGYLTDHD
jgi:acetyl esterase/lipase